LVRRIQPRRREAGSCAISYSSPLRPQLAWAAVFSPDRSLRAVEAILLAIVFDLLDALRRVLLRPYDYLSDRSAGLRVFV